MQCVYIKQHHQWVHAAVIQNQAVQAEFLEFTAFHKKQRNDHVSCLLIHDIL